MLALLHCNRNIPKWCHVANLVVLYIYSIFIYAIVSIADLAD